MRTTEKELQPYNDRRSLWFACIILLGVLVRLPFLFSPLTFGSDTWRQADTASIAHHFFVNGFNILYPQIYWGGSGPGFVETEFQLYPFIISLGYVVFGEHLLLGRFVSLLFAIPTMILFYFLARGIVSSGGTLWSLAFFVVSPLFMRYSVAYMPEAAMLCFYVAALYFFWEWLRDQKHSTLSLAAVMTSLAILVKPTSLHIGLIFVSLAVGRFGLGVFKRKDVWLAGLLSLLPGVLWYYHARNLYLQYGNTFGLFSGGDSKFGALADIFSVHFYFALIKLETIWVFAGVGVIVFTIGLIASLARPRQPILVHAVIAMVIYYMIVARYSRESWGVQYHLFAVPFAALGVGLGLEWVFRRVKRTARTVVAASFVVCTVLGSGYLYGRMLSVADNQLGDHLIQCAAQVRNLVPSDQRVIVSTTSLSEINGVPNNYQEPTIFFYANRYGWSLPANWHSVEMVERYRRAGGRYFVIYSAELYHANAELAHYLTNNAHQIGPGMEAGCGVFRLKDQL